MRIIEISIPHFTPSGTFAEAIAEMNAIADDGFDVVFLMPILPINKGLSKSPYAVTAFDQLNADLGTWDDWLRWLNACHRLGLNVVLDLPLNHTSPAHEWVGREGFYSVDAFGRMHPPVGTNWNDVVQLNHESVEVGQELLRVIRFWLATGVDGFRYDAAAFMPKDVLQQLIRFADDIAERRLFHWCDGVELFHQIEGMSAYFDHEGVKRLKSGEALRGVLSHSSVERIVYLANHDTLHQYGSVVSQWGERHTELRDALMHEKVNLMQSFAEWRDPSARYSFLD